MFDLTDRRFETIRLLVPETNALPTSLFVCNLQMEHLQLYEIKFDEEGLIALGSCANSIQKLTLTSFVLHSPIIPKTGIQKLCEGIRKRKQPVSSNEFKPVRFYSCLHSSIFLTSISFSLPTVLCKHSSIKY